MTGLFSDASAVVMPAVSIGHPVGVPMLPMYSQQLIRAVVDTHLHLPDMFELTFTDEAGTLVADTGLAIGAVVTVKGRKAGGSDTELITGEVTAIEAVCQDAMILTVVRGYEKAHRLQRARRTRTFVNMTDSDIARKIAREAGLRVGTIEASRGTHEHIAQIAQTDWDFLTARAREIGYETGVAGGEFFFRAASSASGGGGGLVDAAASLAGLGSTLTFKRNLHTFLARTSAANLTPDVEVRVWDPMTAEVVVGRSDSTTGSASVDDDPQALARSFGSGISLPVPVPAPPPLPGMPALDMGPTPSATAYLVVDRPVGSGPSAQSAADRVARSVADHVSSTFAEADGDADGDPAIQAGATVAIVGVPAQFEGDWVVTNARHVFDPTEGGYHTRFVVSGRQDRSLLRLTAAGSARQSPTDGLVCAVVTNAKDPRHLGRVKVAMPWLAPDYESDWARVAQVGAGRRSGMLFLPEVGDEVLVGFEFGDPRRPYVLGGLVNRNSDFGSLETSVNGSGAVVERGIASPAGNRLLFGDEVVPPAPRPRRSDIVLGTKDDKLSLRIDQVAGTVSLKCDPAPPVSQVPGALTIECGGQGSITIKAGLAGLKLESDGPLTLKGKTVAIEGQTATEIKGKIIKLN
ncbi:phage baseplate assembly protein V [Actinokineospora sp. UTMC 2448]|uniref:phage baseplate assembly protein V n=1 Tax=Actinokineospora sp. UTMC 2448 TaxID=2268449 RepID=UPI0021646274|nr:phage baseplate assembly protein V [Actinokineospora sp. UTMC 2448]UVS80836.1 tail protein [Actinokineospora sp. UTMC 2448]